MIFAGWQGFKFVIAFPKNSSGIPLIDNSPFTVSEE